MKPGRELDALVAEKVMGWELARDTPFPGVDRRCWRRPGKTSFSSALRHFSTDIAAAWEVVENMSPLRTSLLRGVGMGDWWLCEFFEEEYGNRLGVARSDTAPHAICLAALRAVGVEVDDG